MGGASRSKTGIPWKPGNHASRICSQRRTGAGAPGLVERPRSRSAHRLGDAVRNCAQQRERSAPHIDPLTVHLWETMDASPRIRAAT